MVVRVMNKAVHTVDITIGIRVLNNDAADIIITEIGVISIHDHGLYA